MKFMKLKSLILTGLLCFSLVNVNQIKCENTIKQAVINCLKTQKQDFINFFKSKENLKKIGEGFAVTSGILLLLTPAIFLGSSMPNCGALFPGAEPAKKNDPVDVLKFCGAAVGVTFLISIICQQIAAK